MVAEQRSAVLGGFVYFIERIDPDMYSYICLIDDITTLAEILEGSYLIYAISYKDMKYNWCKQMKMC